jgi:hypothetical protein
VQPLVIPPRDTLTGDQVVALVQSAAIVTDFGADLIGLSLLPTEDLSPVLAGGTVARNSYSTLHLTGKLAITADLDWGSALIRPWYSMSDGVNTAKFNLGAHYTSTPGHSLAESPTTHQVQTYDILSILDDPVADVHSVPVGTGYLAAVESILLARGVQQYIIDQAAAASALPDNRVWAFDDRTTWLTIVNDLLAAVGYAGIWSDWDGRLRAGPYTRPIERGPEWLYDTGLYTGMLSINRSVEHDYYAAPNRWVFYRANNIDSTPPVEGDGIYTYINQRIGETSVEARRRVISRAPIGLDVANHAALVALAQQTIDADMRVPTKWTAQTSPNPLHWHFDRIYLNDPAAGPAADLLCTSWSLPLNGDDQQHEWTLI